MTNTPNVLICFFFFLHVRSPQEDYYCRDPNQKAWPIRWMAPEQIVVQGRSVLDSMQTSLAGNIWWVGLVGGASGLLYCSLDCE